MVTVREEMSPNRGQESCLQGSCAVCSGKGTTVGQGDRKRRSDGCHPAPLLLASAATWEMGQGSRGERIWSTLNLTHLATSLSSGWHQRAWNGAVISQLCTREVSGDCLVLAANFLAVKKMFEGFFVLALKGIFFRVI